MIRGTTPTHVFEVDTDLRQATALYITYGQLGRTVIEKTLDDAEITEESVTVHLTQEDTIRFKNGDVRIQMRVKFGDGSAIASDIIDVPVQAILKEGII